MDLLLCPQETPGGSYAPSSETPRWSSVLSSGDSWRIIRSILRDSWGIFCCPQETPGAVKDLQVLLCPQEISEGSSAPYSETPEGSFARAVLKRFLKQSLWRISHAALKRFLRFCSTLKRLLRALLIYPQETPEGFRLLRVLVMDILESGETIKQIKSLSSTISLSRNTTVSTARRTNRQCLINKTKIKN